MASCCGNRTNPNVEYEITYKHNGERERVSTLSEATMKLAAAPQGGTKRAVAKEKA